MGDTRNYAALDWVQGEIADTLKEARQSLEAYVEDPKDETRIRFCLTHIHQVHGSLQMVQFHSASLLAEEMEHLTQAIMSENVVNAAEAQEVLMRSLLQLPIFLEYIKSQKQDDPSHIVPLLNDLRAARKQSYFSETKLFTPDLSSLSKSQGVKHPVTADSEKLSQVLKKLREMYQFAAASVLRGIKVDENLVYIEKVFNRLEALTRGSLCHPTWLVCSALLDGIRQDEIELSVAVRGLLRHIARQLRLLADKTPQSFDELPKESLFKNLLYYVAKTDASSEKINLVKKRFALSPALLGKTADEITDEELTRKEFTHDPGAIRSVVVALQDEMNNIKSVLDFSLNGQGVPRDIQEILPTVKRVADTLAVLGIGDLRKQMLDQVEALEQISESEQIDESELIQAAGKIIEIEQKLEAVSKAANKNPDLASIDEREVEIDEAKLAVINECRVGLEQSKESIVEYISSQWEKSHLENVGQLLTNIRGGLEMIPLYRPANIIKSCSRFIDEQLVGAVEHPSWETLDTLADAVASIEYYLEHIAGDLKGDSEALLDVAEKSVASLGYQIAPVEENSTQETPTEETQIESTSENLKTVEPIQDVPTGTLDYVEPSDAANETISYSVQNPEVSERELSEEAEQAPVVDQLNEDVATASSEENEEDEEDDVDDEIKEIFIEEAGEVAETLDEYFPRWKLNTDSEDDLTTVRRSFHTLKGSGRMVGASVIGELAWSIENMLNRVIDRTVELMPEHIFVVETVISQIPSFVKDFEENKQKRQATLADEMASWANGLSNGDVNESLKSTMSGTSDLLSSSEEISLDFSSEEQEPEGNVAALDDQEDQALKEIFSSEAQTHLDTISIFIRDMEDAAPIFSPPTDDLQRALHTLKGSAKMAQIAPIGAMAEPLESFAKELISYQVSINQDILQLVKDIVQYTAIGLEQVNAGNQVEIPRVDQFVARTAELREMAVGHLVRLKEQNVDGAHPVDPELLSIFMAEEMNHLLDADVVLQEWQSSEIDAYKINELTKELSTLEEGARHANLPDLMSLSGLLKSVEEKGLSGEIERNDDFFDTLNEGHNALLDMVDAVAAGQHVLPPNQDLVAKIESLFSLAPPHVDAIEEAQNDDSALADMALPVEPEQVEALDSNNFESDLVQHHDSSNVSADENIETIDTFDPSTSETTYLEEDSSASADSVEHDSYQHQEIEYSSGESASEPTDSMLVDVPVDGGLDSAGISNYTSPDPQDSFVPQEELLTPAHNDTELQNSEISENLNDVQFDSGEETSNPEIEFPDLPIAQPENVAEIENESVALNQEPSDEYRVDNVVLVDETLSENDEDLESSSMASDNALQTEATNVELTEIESTDFVDGSAESEKEEISEIFEVDLGEVSSDAENTDVVESIEYSVYSETEENQIEEIVENLSDDDSDETIDLYKGAETQETDFLVTPEETLGESSFSAEDIIIESDDEDIGEVNSEDVVESEYVQIPTEVIEPSNKNASTDILDSADAENASSDSVAGLEIPGLLDDIDIQDENYDEDILEVFIEEALELTEELDEAIHSWESDWADTQSVEAIKRALHTFKGGARLSGLSNLGELTHEYESFLITTSMRDLDESFFVKVHDYQDKVSAGARAVRLFIDSGAKAAKGTPIERGDVELLPETPEGVQLPENLIDHEQTEFAPEVIEVEEPQVIEESPSLVEVQNLENQPDIEDEIQESKESDAKNVDSNVVPFSPKPKVIPTPTHPDAPAEFKMPKVSAPSTQGQATAKKAGPQEVVRVGAELLEELVNLAGETSISRSRLEQYIFDFSHSLEEMDSTLSRLQEQLRRLDIETEAQVLFRQEQMAHEEFDPLEMDRYSALQQLTRSLSESSSDLVDLKEDLNEKLRDTETLLVQQQRINTNLQEGLMRSRMVPFSRLVPRLRRIVRQVASELNKNVSFELDNVEGELDRSVLERMVPPFEHMLRNAVDHGIETPEERLDSGKSETGRIVLTLGREGGDVIIRLADDGRGVDLDRVKQKAVERGLMTEDAELSDHDIMQFILHAGFSTAESVTQISGRGVGMDVVHSEIKQLGGSMSINSKRGHGTEFVIRLPFTVSVNRALMVQIGQDNYAVPLSSIEGIVRVSPFELEHYYDNPDARFEYANENYHVRYLGALLDIKTRPKLEGHVLPLPVLLVRSAEHTMALHVDALMGSREIVVKSLGQQFASVIGLSGATVMGDGAVVVILDPHALVRQEIAITSLPEPEKIEEIPEEIEEDTGTKTVMVVDDSVTVRKVTTRFLEREGFDVITAKDGVDALRVLQDQIPDVMLLDIEMPRMDGFEVAKNIRTTRRWQHLPIIMITSRTGDKHREHALSLGVNKYLGKPYQEDALLGNINELIEEARSTK